MSVNPYQDRSKEIAEALDKAGVTDPEPAAEDDEEPGRYANASAEELQAELRRRGIHVNSHGLGTSSGK